MTAEIEGATSSCQRCRRRIVLGEDTVFVERGVLGPRGVVKLGDEMSFCSDDCVAKHFANERGDKLPKVPRRIP